MTLADSSRTPLTTVTTIRVLKFTLSKFFRFQDDLGGLFRDAIDNRDNILNFTFSKFFRF